MKLSRGMSDHHSRYSPKFDREPLPVADACKTKTHNNKIYCFMYWWPRQSRAWIWVHAFIVWVRDKENVPIGMRINSALWYMVDISKKIMVDHGAGWQPETVPLTVATCPHHQEERSRTHLDDCQKVTIWGFRTTWQEPELQGIQLGITPKSERQV